MNKTKIIRSANSSKNNFTPISNTLFTNKNLSLDTVGLICYLVHLPPNWNIYKEHIQNEMQQRGCGGTKFKRMWKEAKDNGYIIQKKFRNEDGTYDYYYEISDITITTGTKQTYGSTTGTLSTGTLSTGGLSTGGKHTSIISNIEEKNIEEKNILKKSTSNSISTKQERGSQSFSELFYKGISAEDYLKM